VEKILSFNEFFPIVDASVAKIWPDKVVRWCADGQFLRPVFAASCVQHISDLHSKFAIRPHHVRKYMVDIQSATAKNKRGKNDRNHSCKIECPHLLYAQGGHNECDAVIFVRAVMSGLHTCWRN